ncbi:MAG: Flp pilus assembly protein CpaB [Polyangiaceae bacterium]
MNKKALWIALTCTAFAVVLLLSYLHRFEQEVSGGDQVEVLTVQKPIERGELIRDEVLSTRSVPAAYVEDRAIKATERQKIVGIPSATSLSPQQTLMWTDLVITTEDRNLSSLVQPGRRAMTVRATGGAEDTRGNALIRPGDYVDVVLTSEGAADARESTSSVLLQRVLVLAVGQQTRAGVSDAKNTEYAPGSDKLLTLSLSLEEIQLVSLALERGRLSVAVRNPDDPGVQNDIPDIKSSALLEAKARTQARTRTRSGSSAPVRIEEASLP